MALPGDIDILAVHYVQRTYDDFYVPYSQHRYLFLCRNQVCQVVLFQTRRLTCYSLRDTHQPMWPARARSACVLLLPGSEAGGGHRARSVRRGCGGELMATEETRG